MNSNEERLQSAFRDVFDDEQLDINPEMKIKEIKGWDSFVHITLMAAIQDEFGISFNINEVAELETVSEILSLVNRKL